VIFAVMTTFRRHFFYLSVLVAILSGAARADSPDTVKSIPGIEIKTSVDRAEMYVGDLVKYQVTISHDPSIALVPPPLGANLGAFDVKDYQADVETKLPDGRVQNQTTFVLSTFTTGDYIIPPVPIIFQMKDGSRKIMMAEPVPIKVKSLLENSSDSVDIKPLKNPYEFRRNLTIYFLLGGLFVLLILAALVILRRRKMRTGGENVDLRPAWEIAFERLALLRERRFLDDGKVKLYYIELSEIIRWFLGRMHGITVLDMTTDEFLGQFKELTLPEGLFDLTSAFLRHADLVKFAKYVPDRERSEAEFSVAHDIIERARAEEERRQQAILASAPARPAEAPPAGGAS
jgi:hypothetical protein